MHAIDRAARGRRGDHREQAGRIDAVAHFLAFHVAARLQGARALVHAQRRQQRVARLLGRRDGHNGNDKHHAHRRQHGPALAPVADLAAE